MAKTAIPDNVSRALVNSQKLIEEVFEEAKRGAKDFSTELTRRKYLAYTLKFILLISAVFITAGLLPHYLAISIAIIYSVETVLTNSKRLVAIAQAKKAYETTEKKLVRTHMTEQAEIFKESDPIELIQKQTELNLRLTKEAHKQFETIESAVDQSDLETLQALSLDDEKLNQLTKYIQSTKG